MASYCEQCGKLLQDGESCGCAAATPPVNAEPAPQPAPHETPAQPPYDPAAAPPPPYDPAAQAPYPPAALPYDPAAQQAYPPPPPYPPQGDQPYPPHPGQPPYPPQGYPPQGGPQPYPPQPAGPTAQQQVQQSFGEFTSALGGFAKDPVGAAAKIHSPAVAGIFLGVQAICFLIFAAIFLGSAIYDMLALMGYGRYWYADESLFTFTSYLKMFIFGVLEIGFMYGCLLGMTKLTKIALEPKKLLSAVANASIPWSASFLVMMVISLLFGALDPAGLFLNTIVASFAVASSLCLLEIGIRAQMPQGEGNVARMITIACAFAAQAGLSLLVLRLMSGELLG